MPIMSLWTTILGIKTQGVAFVGAIDRFACHRALSLLAALHVVQPQGGEGQGYQSTGRQRTGYQSSWREYITSFFIGFRHDIYQSNYALHLRASARFVGCFRSGPPNFYILLSIMADESELSKSFLWSVKNGDITEVKNLMAKEVTIVFIYISDPFICCLMLCCIWISVAIWQNFGFRVFGQIPSANFMQA